MDIVYHSVHSRLSKKGINIGFKEFLLHHLSKMNCKNIESKRISYSTSWKREEGRKGYWDISLLEISATGQTEFSDTGSSGRRWKNSQDRGCMSIVSQKIGRLKVLSSEFMLFPLQRPMVLPSEEIDLFRKHLVSDS